MIAKRKSYGMLQIVFKIYFVTFKHNQLDMVHLNLYFIQLSTFQIRFIKLSHNKYQSFQTENS